MPVWACSIFPPVHRSALLLASLNHPNIARIRGIEKADWTRALVLELFDETGYPLKPIERHAIH